MVQSKQRFNIEPWCIKQNINSEIGIFVTKLDVCFVAMLYLLRIMIREYVRNDLYEGVRRN